MRTIVELPESLVNGLAEVCEKDSISRAEAIRRAVDNYLKVYQPAKSDDDSAFGVWKSRGVDALQYEDEIRSEWRSD